MTTHRPADPAMTDEEIERLAYSMANAKLGEGPAARCEGPTGYEIAQARFWAHRARHYFDTHLAAEIAARKEAEGLYAREGHKALVLQEALSAAEARAALVDAPAAAVVGGWKLVPPMATPKMLHAADSRFAFDQDHYAALLAAAPSPPPVEPVAPFDPVAFMQDDSGLPCRFDPPVEKGEVAVAVAAEREACAQVVRRVRDTWIKGDASSAIGNAFQRACDQALDGILGRARGEAG